MTQLTSIKTPEGVKLQRVVREGYVEDGGVKNHLRYKGGSIYTKKRVLSAHLN